MYKLIYSQKADDHAGHGIAINTSGETVKYTAQHNEAISGPWKSHYLWDDAQEVGILDRVISYNTKHNLELIDKDHPYRYWR